MKIHSLNIQEVYRTLVTSEHGLAEDEAKRRLAEFGFNEITETKKKSLILKFFNQLSHFLAILLWIAATLSFISEYYQPGEGMLTLGIAIIAVILINAAFTFIQEYKAEKALVALKKLLPFYVSVLRDNTEKKILAREIVPGDVILLSEGEKVPADARLIETHELKINKGSLTGETEPILGTHEIFNGEFVESPNIAFAGTTIISGSAKAVVFSTGMRTEFGGIAHLTSAVESGLSPLQKEIIKTSRILAAIAAVIGIFFFLLGFVIERSFWNNFIFAIGITVALVPEGILPTVTLSLAMGSQRMSRRNALIKTLTSVETLGAVTVICTDKTGTLTQNKMTAAKLWFDEKIIDAVDIAKEKPFLINIAYFCNNARFSEGQYKGDPTEAAIYKIARESLGDITHERISEIPFDSDRKRMTTINRAAGRMGQTADNFYVFTKGAMESVLPLCSHLLIKNERVVIDEVLMGKIKNSYYSMTDMGLRVLAFAYKEIKGIAEIKQDEIEKELIFAGMIGIEDPPRPEVYEAIARCHKAGIKIIMMTGDGSRTAAAIGKETGLVKAVPVIIEGHEFDQMDDNELRRKLSAKEVIFARMTPKHKMRVVTVLKEEGEVVAVTGDGVNDAPALKKADIGIAMGIAGTDVAKEAADIVLLDDNFATIVNAIEEGRTVYENIKKFITYILASNIPEAVPYLAYTLFGIPLPLTVIQILAVDLGTDMLPALALAAEKPTPNIMKQPPRKLNERLLNLSLLGRAYLFLGPLEACACMFGFFLVLYSGGWIWGQMLPTHNILYMQATTACLTAIIITQAGNVFACRSAKESALALGIFSNRLILLGIITSLLLLLFIVYHPWGNKIFNTYPLSFNTWLMLAPFAFILFFADEIRKFLNRKYSIVIK